MDILTTNWKIILFLDRVLCCTYSLGGRRRETGRGIDGALVRGCELLGGEDTEVGDMIFLDVFVDHVVIV